LYSREDVYLCERVLVGSAWSAATVVNAAVSRYQTYVLRRSGELRVAYQSPAGIIAERVFSGSGYGAESNITSTGATQPKYIETVSGELRIGYRRSADGFFCEKAFDETTEETPWGSEVVSIDYSITGPTYHQDQTGRLFITFRRVADGYLVERVLPRYARVGAGIIESGSNANGSYVKFSDGTLQQWGKNTANFTKGYITFPVPFIDTNYGFSCPSAVEPDVSWVITALVDSATIFTNKVYISPIKMPGATDATLPAGLLRWMAIGRWK